MHIEMNIQMLISHTLFTCAGCNLHKGDSWRYDFHDSAEYTVSIVLDVYGSQRGRWGGGGGGVDIHFYTSVKLPL